MSDIRVAFVMATWHDDLVDRTKLGFFERMAELGHPEYRMEYRAVSVAPGETFTVDAWRSYLYFPSDNNHLGTNLRVESDSGVLEVFGTAYAEMSYEHHGRVRISTGAFFAQTIHFIEVIPQTHSLCQPTAGTAPAN